MIYNLLLIFFWYTNSGDVMKKFLIIILLLILVIPFFLFKGKKLDNLVSKDIDDVLTYLDENKINYELNYEYSDKTKDTIIKQSVSENTKIKKIDKLVLTISKGTATDTYKKYNVNELGYIPVMMYHGIHNKLDSDTKYIGGNVDKDGYQRTKEAFIRDLEFYYNSGYRMIRLIDYVNGNIDTKLGYSPIVITFDDGLENAIKVTGLDSDGNIIIDPNSAVGILESFKKKYKDYNVTATFFINGGLFNQPMYNEKIINWLIDNGYDIGNHSYTHANFKKISENESVIEIGKMYEKLDSIIKGKYINIVALPFGSPYTSRHPNFKHIISGVYNNKEYNTISTLKVGASYDYSPFDSRFNKIMINRIRAYDNNGTNFDIEYTFKKLESTRYISDGDKNTVVYKKDTSIKINTNLEKIAY